MLVLLPLLDALRRREPDGDVETLLLRLSEFFLSESFLSESELFSPAFSSTNSRALDDLLDVESLLKIIGHFQYYNSKQLLIGPFSIRFQYISARSLIYIRTLTAKD